MLQGFSLVMASRVYSLAVERGILIAMAFLVAEAQVLGQVGSVVAAPKPWSERRGSGAVVHRFSCSTARGIFPDQGSSPRLLHGQVGS